MPIDLTIVTPEGQAFQGPVESVVLPGAEGDFGVLEGHEPFLSALRIGALELDAGGHKRLAAVSGGFAEVHSNEVSVMVGTCEFADEIDRERAERARTRAHDSLERMRGSPEEAAKMQEFQDAYSRAITRLHVVEKKS